MWGSSPPLAWEFDLVTLACLRFMLNHTFASLCSAFISLSWRSGSLSFCAYSGWMYLVFLFLNITQFCIKKQPPAPMSGVFACAIHGQLCHWDTEKIPLPDVWTAFGCGWKVKVAKMSFSSHFYDLNTNCLKIMSDLRFLHCWSCIFFGLHAANSKTSWAVHP